MFTNDDGAITLRLRSLAQTTMRRQIWLWNQYVPAGTMTIIAGSSGIGKSTLAYWMAAQLNAGTLAGEYYGQPQPVIIWSEDDWHTTTAPRLTVAGVDPSMVAEIVASEAGRRMPLRFPLHADKLATEIETSGAKMVILDPLASLTDGNLNHGEIARATLDPLMNIAHRTGCAIVVVAHNRKGGGAAAEVVAGSAQVVATTRSLLSVAADDDGELVFAQTKSNLGIMGKPLAFNIESRPIVIGGVTTDYGAAVLLGETDKSINEIINRNRDYNSEGDKGDVVDWLISYLESCGGEAPANDVIKAGERDGFSKDQLKNAKGKAGVASGRQSTGFASGGSWLWKLSQGGHKSAREHDMRATPLCALVDESDAMCPRCATPTAKYHSLGIPIPRGCAEHHGAA